MKLILGLKNKTYTMGRFNSTPIIYIQDHIHLSDSIDNVITLKKDGNITWEQDYNECVEDSESKIENWLNTHKKDYIWKLNQIDINDANLIIMPGRLFSFGHTEHNIILGRPHLASMNMTDKYIIIHRFIMCIYHYLNNINRRLINPEQPYGIIQRYLSAQACWNLNMFSSSFVVNAFGTMDTVNIVLGYVNTACYPVDVIFDVTIKATGEGLGLLGIYLDSASIDHKIGSYRIQRDFSAAEGDDCGMQDITNPNDCQWQKNGTWSTGLIHQEFIDVTKNSKAVYTITKNPDVIGYVRYSDSEKCSFDITINVSVSDGVKRTYTFEAQCYSLIEGKVTEYKPAQPGAFAK